MSGLVGTAVFSMTATASAAPPKVVENAKMAVRVLQLRNPSVAWREPPVRADFTDDQVADLAIMGVDSGMLVVALMVGPVNGGSEMVRFRWKVEDGVAAPCLRDASLAAEELGFPEHLFDASRSLAAKAAGGRGVKGLRVSAPPCDVFHLYWDAPTRNLNWWRQTGAPGDDPQLQDGSWP